MSFSINTVTSDGVETQFPINFTNGIYNRDSVKVFVEDDLDGGGDQLERSFTWINDGLIELDVAAPSGKAVTIQRIMNKGEPDVNYVNGAILDESNLNQSLDQLLAIQHEILDGVGIDRFNQDVDMGGYKLTNLGSALAPTDGTNLLDVETLVNAAAIGDVTYNTTADTVTYTINGITQAIRARLEKTVIPFDTLALATASTNVQVGNAVNLAEHTTGNGGGGMWDVIAGTGTANGYNIVAHDTLSLSFVLRVNAEVETAQIGATTGESSGSVQAAFDLLPASGGTVKFSSNCTFGDILITDKENVNIDFGMNTMTATAGAAHLIKLTNSSASFKRGGVWKNIIAAGTVTDAFLLVDGGAWSNQEFSRVFSNNGVGPDLIKLNNETVTLRNPSNFKFSQVWNKSFDITNAFHYYAAAATTAVDNFQFDQILHWSNQVTPSTLKFTGSGAQYSKFNNIYGALYATGAAVISTGTSAITRSDINGVLMEGSQNGRECLSGVYVETKISNVVNFYDESLYSTNYAVNAKVQSSEMFNCLLQDSGSGYSALPSVILKTLSNKNTLHECNVVTDNGSDNLVLNNVKEYSEGTWTPVMAFGGGSVGVTYTTQQGWYSRIGNTIHYNCTIILSSKGSSTGAATITGLPVASKSTTTSSGSLNVANLTFADRPQAIIDASTTAIRIREVNNAGIASNITDVEFTNSSVVIVTGTYFV